MIHDMRSHWGIIAATALPPDVQEPLLYLKLPKQGPKSDLVRLRVPTLYPREMEILERNQWEVELDDIRQICCGGTGFMRRSAYELPRITASRQLGE